MHELNERSVVIALTEETKETLEIFRNEQVEKVKKQLDKGHSEEIRESLQSNFIMFKNANHEQLLKMYIAFHQTMNRDHEKGRTLNNQDKKRMINILKSHRSHVDEALESIGGKRFRKSYFDAETHNDIVRTAFSDALMYLNHGNLKALEAHLERCSKEDWL